MFCKTCKGNQRVPVAEVHGGIKGIWTKTCPDCKGTGFAEESKAMKEMRESDAYKVGYLRSSVKTILAMLERGNTESAIQHCKDTLVTIPLANDPNTL